MAELPADDVRQVRAPWSTDQVASLNGYQRSGVFHEFTCGSDHEDHEPLLTTEDCWVCPTDCGYEQHWAWRWMADWSWRDMDPLAALRTLLNDGEADA